MNKLKLGLSNFQSISDGELEFETGLNFIIGQSNSGKSATFRALKACLSNPAGSQRFIKKGHSCAEVSLEYNGNIIIWKRTKSESSYEINGEKYVKTGKSSAFNILDNTGFARDCNDNIMNIEEELQLPFPYGISKFDLFKLFENVFCISDSALILKSAKEHENQVKDEIVLLESDVIKTKKKIEELEKFKAEVDLDKLVSFKNKLMSKKERIEFLSDGMDVIMRAIEVENIPIPKPQKFRNLTEELSNFRNLMETVKTVKSLHSVSEEIKRIKRPINVDIRQYEELKVLLNTSNKIKELVSINFPESPEIVENLLEKRKDLKKLQQISNQLKELQAVTLPKYTIINKLDKYNELKKYLSELKGIVAEGRALKVRKDSVQEKSNTLTKKLEEYKVCPLCHRPIEK